MTKGKNDNHLIIYQDDNGLVKINVRFADEDVWITQGQLAEIYDTTQQNIALHIKNIYTDKELTDEATHKKYLLVRQEGSRNVQRNIDHYNLDMIIALGYRVQSQVATRFRRWATERLHEYIQKGFTMDDDRLKQGGNRYFRELLQRIRDIRASERNFYQQVTDISMPRLWIMTRTQTSPAHSSLLCRINSTMPYTNIRLQKLSTTVWIVKNPSLA